jgi:hypothetical protein
LIVWDIEYLGIQDEDLLHFSNLGSCKPEGILGSHDVFKFPDKPVKLGVGIVLHFDWFAPLMQPLIWDGDNLFAVLVH